MTTCPQGAEAAEPTGIVIGASGTHNLQIALILQALERLSHRLRGGAAAAGQMGDIEGPFIMDLFQDLCCRKYRYPPNLRMISNFFFNYIPAESQCQPHLRASKATKPVWGSQPAHGSSNPLPRPGGWKSVELQRSS
jgi:hypothetical protein